MIVARVVNDWGLAFNVRLVQYGERYGHEDCLVHAGHDPLVEFWDATYEQDPRFTLGLGQFAARYFFSTIGNRNLSNDGRPVRGLDLCGHVAEWKLTAGNVTDAVAAAEAAIERRRRAEIAS